MDWLTTSTILQDLGDFSNQVAWRQFAERFRSPIVRFARKLGLSDADAEEVAQETLVAFAAAYRDGRYDRSKGRLSRWLFGIAYRQIRNAQRRVARRAGVEAPPDRSSFWADVPDKEASTHWDEQWEQALLDLCLQRVRQEVEPATMQAFELVMQANRSPADVAHELGVPVKTIYNAKYTVLTRVRELCAALEDLT
jgi:RNA polymerase sigma-70 factor (ECF subfamily)